MLLISKTSLYSLFPVLKSCSWGKPTPFVHGGNQRHLFMGETNDICSWGKPTPFVHGGNPQDHNGSPRPQWLPKTTMAP